MADEKRMRGYPTLGEIREFLGASAVADGHGRVFARVSGLEDAQDDTVIFATDEGALAKALESKAGLILGPAGSGDEQGRVLGVKNPRTAFTLVYQRWFAAAVSGEIHSSAVIDGEVGRGSSVGAGTVIERGAKVGEECSIGPRVVIHAGVTVGDRVKVKAGAVLGASGFGFARTSSGYVGFPQIGTLAIEDEVEVGANTTIDRGALGETRIGRGTKIDNLVHIAHNCRIGEDVIIAAQVGMAGSTTIEDGAMLGGQAGLGEHVTIGRGVILGGQGGVLPGKRIDGEGEVYWGTPAQPVREYLRSVARMRKK